MRKVLFGAIVVVNLLFAGWLVIGLSGPVHVSTCEDLTGMAADRCVAGDPDYVVSCDALDVEENDLCQHGFPVHNYPVPAAPAMFLWMVATFVLFAAWVVHPPEGARSPRFAI